MENVASGGFSDEEPWRTIPASDLNVVTSGGKSFPVHSSVLASVSPVLENIILDRPRRRGNAVPILGVPSDAVAVFLRCLYTSRSPSEVEMERFGVHLLVLSHAMRVSWLKRSVTAGLVATLTVDNVIDVLQLARQCDVPRLRVRCMNLIKKEYKLVVKTEGWSFVQENDPWLELEVLQFLQEAEKREKRRKRMKKEQEVYTDLSESMECLLHICTEGCTSVGPKDQTTTTTTRHGPCQWGRTCEGLQESIKHLATCGRKKEGLSCVRCSRMWQLLRLHSSICDTTIHTCKVPLCSRFKERSGMEKRGEVGKWAVLAKKVVSAKVISTLSKRKREDDIHKLTSLGRARCD